MTDPREPFDLFVIGGGVNGCAIARDASGRGLSVVLAEMGDLASATSSASTKLFHGGLRYLEYFEIRLVRESLIEREVLLRAMPHISWPMRFVLPYHARMRFEAETPVSRLLSTVMPWMRGRRPAWMIRLGLFVYDHLGGRKILPATATLDLAHGPEGAPLAEGFARGWEYSDCWVDDARLVVLTARDAAARGAVIEPRTKVIEARRMSGPEGDLWAVTVEDTNSGAVRVIRARALVNAAGPWVGDVIHDRIQVDSGDSIRLVRGSHIVIPRLYDHDKAYFLQGSDGRIIFTIPYEEDFTLIGTTEADHPDPWQKPVCTDAEAQYLCDFVNRYFRRQIGLDDIVWRYSGVRPLHEEGIKSATAATRDYALKLDEAGAPLLNVFGGKITTHRHLAQSALDRLARFFPQASGAWTAGAPLPGGDFAVDGVADLRARLAAACPFLEPATVRRMVRAYGTESLVMMQGAGGLADLGEDFGAGLFEREVIWLMEREFARSAEDVVWRRSKLGLRLSPEAIARLDAWMAARLAKD